MKAAVTLALLLLPSLAYAQPVDPRHELDAVLGSIHRQIDNLAAQITSDWTQMEDLNKQVKQAQGDKNAAEAKVAELQRQLDALKAKEAGKPSEGTKQ